MTEDYLLEQVSSLFEDDEIIDFILNVKNEDKRKALLQALDKYQGHDSFLVILDDDNKDIIMFHVLIKSAYEGDSGLILHSSPNHEALIFYLGRLLERLPKDAPFYPDYEKKMEVTSEILREMAGKIGR